MQTLLQKVQQFFTQPSLFPMDKDLKEWIRIEYGQEQNYVQSHYQATGQFPHWRR